MKSSFSILAALAIVGCAIPARAETLPIVAVYPAGSDNLAMLNTIHMGRFSGRDGPTFALQLEQQLRDVYIRGARYYSVTVGSGGQRADARVSGSADSSVESRSEVVKQRKCVAQNAKGKCVEHRNVDVRCTRRYVTMTYTLSVTGHRGERLYSASKPVVDSTLVCPNSGGVPPVDVVVAELVKAAAYEVRREFAPIQLSTDVRVKEGTSGLQGGAKKTFKDAVKATKRNVASACELWNEVDYLVPNHAPTLFNLGLCAESERDYDRAEELYNRSSEMDRSERYVVEAIERLGKRRKADRQLEMQASRRAS